MLTIKYVLSLLALLMALVGLGGGVARAEKSDEVEPPAPVAELAEATEPTLAQFEGRSIDLSQDWGDAQVCAVLTATDIRCYRTEKEANADLGGEPGLSDDSLMLAGCSSGWVCLYDLPNYGGRKLQFRDRGYWQFLSSYGFQGRASSLVNARGYTVRFWNLRTGGHADVPSIRYLGSLGYWNNFIDMLYIF